MSADDQQFLDMLSSIPNQVKQYSGDVADFIDKVVEKAADNVRDGLATVPWLPDSVRPSPPARPECVQKIVPLSTYERVHDWVVRHKILSGVVVFAVGYVTYRTVRQSRLLRKTRRAKRARNGGRLEVVVIAGSPALPLTKSLSLDMERRGFVVYIVCSTMEDEVAVQNLSRPDIKPLTIDITDPLSAGASIEQFAAYLQTPHAAVPRAKPTYLSLTSVILIPSLNYQTSPIATIPPSSFADLFNTHLLHPILTIQSFLPLLTSRLTPHEKEKDSREKEQRITKDNSKAPKVLVFTPSIISSINPPFHAPEATVCSALSAFTEVLTAELRPLAIPVTHVQLGTFDFSSFTPVRLNPGAHGQGNNTTANNHHHHHHHHYLPPAETLQWPEAARHAYGRNFVSQSASAISAGRVRGLKGSSLRELHNAVFDVLDGSEKSDIVRVGLGAGLYGFVGRWAPRSLVAWMMGIRRVDELGAWESSHSGNSTGSGSSGGDSENGDASEFVAVGREHDETHDDSGIDVWRER